MFLLIETKLHQSSKFVLIVKTLVTVYCQAKLCKVFLICIEQVLQYRYVKIEYMSREKASAYE